MPHARLYDDRFEETTESMTEARKPILEPFRQRMVSRSAEDAKGRYRELEGRFEAFTDLMGCVRPRNPVKPR